VVALTGVPVAAVACGFGFSCAVGRDGSVYAWGANENGRCGFGDTVDRLAPEKVTHTLLMLLLMLLLMVEGTSYSHMCRCLSPPRNCRCRCWKTTA
jgi:alpha-tubulin suppressor-like RCC1 family protein